MGYFQVYRPSKKQVPILKQNNADSRLKTTSDNYNAQMMLPFNDL